MAAGLTLCLSHSVTFPPYTSWPEQIKFLPHQNCTASAAQRGDRPRRDVSAPLLRRTPAETDLAQVSRHGCAVSLENSIDL